MSKAKESINQVLISGKLGDGGMYKCKSNVNYYAQYVSTCIDYLNYKRDELIKHGIECREIKEQPSGYKKGATSNVFGTRVHKKITQVAEISIKESIDAMSLEGLIMLYLDDGSYHQRKRFMHLYCNEFSDEETNYLIEYFYDKYPEKKCSLRRDNKKDGRSYPYIYIPVSVANSFKIDVEDFLVRNNIVSLLYKVGNQPSTTIESTIKGSA